MINAADLAHHSAENEWDDQIEVSCCTFGAPATGNTAFVKYFDATVKESTRVTVEDDPIIYLPPFPWFSVSPCAQGPGLWPDSLVTPTGTSTTMNPEVKKYLSM